MNRQRFWRLSVFSWAVVVAVWSTLYVTATPTPVAAQEEAADEEKADDAAPADKTEKASGESGETKHEQNFLMWLIETSGAIGAFLLILSIYFVATVMKMFFELRPEIIAPPATVQECENLLKAKDFLGVYKLCKKEPSFFTTVLAAGLAELPHGLNEARESMERQGDALVVEMEKKISMLAVLGSLGPMIGLLGTLKGMIASFSVIAMSDTAIKSSQVAGGISEALVLTFEGVLLSVPAIYFFALFKNKISSNTTQTMLANDDFVRRVNAAMRAKPAGAAAPSA